MQVGTFGVFQGGDVSVNTVQTGIDISATVVRTADGRSLGFGDPGRKVLVQFSALSTPFAFTAIRPSPLDAPIYNLTIAEEAGYAFIAFDVTDTNDIVVIAEPATGYIVLAKVTWPANTTLISQLELSFADRQESRLLVSRNPLDAKDLYTAGMRFGDTEFNKPLIAFSVLSEVLQGEALAKNNEDFSFVRALLSDVSGQGSTLTVRPLKVVLRRRVGQDVFFTVIETKTDFTFTYAVGSTAGDRIYIWINPQSGSVESGLSFTPADGILVGYGDVPFSAVGLEDVRWVLAAQTANANVQSGTSAAIQAITLPAGFVRPLEAVPSTTVQKYLLLRENVAIINGVEYRVPEQPVTLPDAPINNERLDLVLAEFYQRVEPSPPTNGEFFQSVPGVGFIVAKSKLTVIPDVTHADAQTLLLQPNITGLGGGTFVREAAGYFSSSYADSANGRSYALPVALVSRFNQAPYTDTNPSGGGLAGTEPTRPDGKQHNFIHLDEVELPGPVVSLHGYNPAALFGRALQDILKGAHPNKLGQSVQVPAHYSKKPLQIDAISGTEMLGANLLSAPDGARREWSAAPTPYWVGTNFFADADAQSVLHTFEEGTRTLVIKAPAGADLFLGGAGGVQPVVQAVWVESNLPVQFTGPWQVGADSTSATGALDTTVASYAPAGRIAVSFSVVQRPEAFLTNVPKPLLRATLNGNPLLAATPGVAQNYTLAGLTASVDAVGRPDKCEAASLAFVIPSDGTDVVLAPAVVSGTSVVGVREVTRVADGTVLGIKATQLIGDSYRVTLAAPVAAGDEIRLTLLLAGKICNVVPANRAVTDFAEATWFSQIILGEQSRYNLVLPENRVLRGVFAYRRAAGAGLTQGVFLDGFLYPATVTGLDRNFMQVDLVLTAADFASLPAEQQSKWQVDAGSGYYVLNAGSYTLQLAILWSAAPLVTDQLKFTYAFDGLPFMPVVGGQDFELVHRGFVIASNSSAANRATSYFAPLAEKFPLARGTVQALNVTAPETVFSDPASLGMNGLFPVEGTKFSFDGALSFDVSVGAPGLGFLCWVCLVRVDRALRILAYVSLDGALVLDDPAKAFLTYCDANYAV